MLAPINKLTREQFVGLDISDYSLEAVLLSKRGRKRYKVVSYARFRLAPGIIEDGYISQPEKLQEAIKKLFSLGKPHPMNTKNVFIAIPESKIFNHIFSLPKELRHKELLSALDHQAEEYIPEPLENLLTAHKILGNREDKTEIFFAAVKKNVVQELVGVFETMNMNIIGITVEAMATFSGLADELKTKESLLLDIGARTTIATIFDKNSIRDSINISIAGDNITDAIVKKLGISHTDAEDKKRQFGMDATINEGEVMWIIQGQMQPVADELKKFIHYYEESTGRKLEQLILTGGTSQIKGLDKYFGDNLNLPTSLAYSFIKDKNLPERLISQKYINALGLAKFALQEKWDISFYQTERLDLQQNITTENIMIWLRVIGRFFGNIPSMLKKVFSKWYAILALVLIILGIVVWVYKDKITNNSLVTEPVYFQNLTVGLTDRALDDYIVARPIDYPLVLSDTFPGLTYLQATKALAKQAVDQAVVDSKNLATKDTSVLPEIINISNLVISPNQTELASRIGKDNLDDYLLTIDDVLELRANYTFFIINNNDIKLLILNDLPSSEAAKLNQMPIESLTNQVLDYDRSKELMRVKSTLVLDKPMVDKKGYWPF